MYPLLFPGRRQPPARELSSRDTWLCRSINDEKCPAKHLLECFPTSSISLLQRLSIADILKARLHMPMGVLRTLSPSPKLQCPIKTYLFSYLPLNTMASAIDSFPDCRFVFSKNLLLVWNGRACSETITHITSQALELSKCARINCLKWYGSGTSVLSLLKTSIPCSHSWPISLIG